MGVFLYDDLLAIVSLRFQKIHILQIRDSGNLVDVRAIGEFCREDDELFLNSNAQVSAIYFVWLYSTSVLLCVPLHKLCVDRKFYKFYLIKYSFSECFNSSRFKNHRCIWLTPWECLSNLLRWFKTNNIIWSSLIVIALPIVKPHELNIDIYCNIHVYFVTCQPNLCLQ